MVGADADALVFVPGLITVLFLVAAVDGRDCGAGEVDAATVVPCVSVPLRAFVDLVALN